MPVIVLGMHRSGTSAVARLVNLLGPRLSRDDDLVQERADNPSGHWESRSLYQVNEKLFLALGGTWFLPPRPPDDWWRLPGVQQAYPSARQAFLRVYDGGSEWVWKDPRNCLTLPFWLAALGCRPVIVFIHRNPLEVHASLEKRNGLAREVAVELWEIYNRQAMQYSQGLPLFAVGYQQLLDAPGEVLAGLAGFLHRHQVLPAPTPPDSTEVKDFLNAGLRHSRFSPADVVTAPLTPGQKALFEILQDLPQPNDAFQPPTLPASPPVTVLSGLRSAMGPVLTQLKSTIDATMMQLNQVRQQLQGAKSGQAR